VRVTVESLQPGITVIRPSESLEMNNVSAFRHTLQTEVQRADRGLVLVLAEVTFIDSSGIAVLIEGLKWSRERNLPYVLVALPAAVQMVIELARLENFFTIAANLDEATALILQSS
jgi:anti-sigma B factor antagonist